MGGVGVTCVGGVGVTWVQNPVVDRHSHTLSKHVYLRLATVLSAVLGNLIKDRLTSRQTAVYR